MDRLAPGVCRFKLVDNVSDKRRVGYDFKTGTSHALPSLAEIQRRFLEALYKAGFAPFDSDDDGHQYWRRP